MSIPPPLLAFRLLDLHFPTFAIRSSKCLEVLVPFHYVFHAAHHFKIKHYILSIQKRRSQHFFCSKFKQSTNCIFLLLEFRFPRQWFFVNNGDKRHFRFKTKCVEKHLLCTFHAIRGWYYTQFCRTNETAWLHCNGVSNNNNNKQNKHWHQALLVRFRCSINAHPAQKSQTCAISVLNNRTQGANSQILINARSQ